MGFGGGEEAEGWRWGRTEQGPCHRGTGEPSQLGLRALGIHGYKGQWLGQGLKNPDQVNHILRGPRGSPETQQSRADKESRRALMVGVLRTAAADRAGLQGSGFRSGTSVAFLEFIITTVPPSLASGGPSFPI